MSIANMNSLKATSMGEYAVDSVESELLLPSVAMLLLELWRPAMTLRSLMLMWSRSSSHCTAEDSESDALSSAASPFTIQAQNKQSQIRSTCVSEKWNSLPRSSRAHLTARWTRRQGKLCQEWTCWWSIMRPDEEVSPNSTIEKVSDTFFNG